MSTASSTSLDRTNERSWIREGRKKKIDLFIYILSSIRFMLIGYEYKKGNGDEGRKCFVLFSLPWAT